jgi:limonene-1,2-epoxide hydrolase
MSAQGHDAVRKICENWATLSLEEFREVMAEDCDYRNVPFEGDRHIGPDAAHAILSTMGTKWDIDLEVVNLVGDDRVVMTERTEHFTRKDGSREPFVLPVMGVFELRDGKVVAWRDYFERSHLRLRRRFGWRRLGRHARVVPAPFDQRRSSTHRARRLNRRRSLRSPAAPLPPRLPATATHCTGCHAERPTCSR